MLKVILYDDACEVLNVENYFKSNVEVCAYIKGYEYDKSNFKNMYSLNDLSVVFNEEDFDFIILNTRHSSEVYAKLRELKIEPNKIIDTSFFFYDKEVNSFKEKFLNCRESDCLNFDNIFLGRTYIEDYLIKEYFDNCINISNGFSDIHYDYHILYYLLKNNKITSNSNLVIFMDYGMLYKNLEVDEDKYNYRDNFEKVFKVHNKIEEVYSYASICYESFNLTWREVFKEDISERFINIFSMEGLSEDTIKYNVQLETMNYSESNLLTFRMNSNLIVQTMELLSEHNINTSFVILPVHESYKTYINRTLKKEFYSIINNFKKENINILDYFDFHMEDKYFSSPNNLNLDGCRNFLNSLSNDIKNKIFGSQIV